MAKTKTSVPFMGTKEQEEKLLEVINEYKEVKGSLIPIMQKAQEIYGYLPIEVQQIIAEGLNIPMAEVYGVATFYAQFALNPKGKYEIAVCLGTACYVKGAQAIVDRITEILGIGPEEITPDRKFSLTCTRCIGACGLAPVMTINGEVYGRLTVEDVDDILNKYIKESEEIQ